MGLSILISIGSAFIVLSVVTVMHSLRSPKKCAFAKWLAATNAIKK